MSFAKSLYEEIRRVATYDWKVSLNVDDYSYMNGSLVRWVLLLKESHLFMNIKTLCVW